MGKWQPPRVVGVEAKLVGVLDAAFPRQRRVCLRTIWGRDDLRCRVEWKYGDAQTQALELVAPAEDDVVVGGCARVKE